MDLRKRWVREIESRLGPLYIGSQIRFQHLRKVFRRYVRPGDIIIDAGCGRGSNTIPLATAWPICHFRGYDLCIDSVREANVWAEEKGCHVSRSSDRLVSDWGN